MNDRVKITVLDNGLRVVSETMPHLRSAAVGVWVAAGARSEKASENGLAHMLEHMAFKGTARRSAYDIAAEMETVGGHLNAYTSREQTAYYARLLSADLELGIDILADILQNPAFEADELERERGVIIQEIGQTEDTPDDILFDHLQATAYPEQAMGRSILGTVERVSNMDANDLRRFMDRNYCARQMICCAAGDVEHDKLVDLAARQFADLPAGGSENLEPAHFQGGDFREVKDLEQAHLALAFPGIDYNHTDFYGMQVMSTILGGGMSSRLFQEVREKRGLCYSVFSFASSFADSGLFGIYAGTGADEVAELGRVLCSEFARLGSDANEEEVARAKAQLKAGLMMSMEAPASRAEQMARQMIVFGRPVGADEIIEKIDAVDVNTVRQLVNQTIQPEQFVVCALGPVEKLDPYGDLVAQLS